MTPETAQPFETAATGRCGNSAQKRILLATFGSFGDLHPYVALGLELQRRGHVACIATSALYEDKIRALGLDFAPVRPDLGKPEENLDLMRRVMSDRGGTEVVIREIFMSALRDTFTDTHAAAADCDLIVTHPLTYAARMTAELRGKPWISTALAPISFFSSYDPCVVPTAPQMRHLYGVLPRFVLEWIISLGKRSISHWCAPVHDLRQELGLPKIPHPIFEGQFSPIMTLALFSPELMRQHRGLPVNTHITGFPFHDADAGRDGGEELQRFLANGEPPVIFTLGSSAVWTAGTFYDVAADAIHALGRRAILLVGADARNRMPEPPQDVLLAEYVPFSSVFPQCSAIVHQGGVGTTGQAMRSGRPMLVVPFAHDQHDNAHRVCKLGVARSCSRHSFHVRRAAKDLHALLTESGYTRSAQALGERMSHENGSVAACDRLLSVLGQ